jgi:O-antigen ligase
MINIHVRRLKVQIFACFLKNRLILYLSVLVALKLHANMPTASLTKTSQLNNKLFKACLYLVALSIPMYYRINALAVVLLAISWLFTDDFKTTLSQLKKRPLLICWILWYALHALSYFYSDDKTIAGADLESKLSILLLPLIIGTQSKENELQLKGVFTSFLLGLVTICFLSIGSSYLAYQEDQQLSHFFYHQLVHFADANAVYMSWYVLIGIAILLLAPPTFFFTKNKGIQIATIIILEIFLLMLSARMVLLCQFAIILPILIYQSTKKDFTKGLINSVFAIVLLAIYGIIFLTNNPIKERFKEMTPSQTKNWVSKEDPSKQQFNNFTLRIFIWKTSMESIQQEHLYWYGSGIGDVATIQQKTIEKHNFELNEGNRAKKIWEFNMHNMYIQELFMLGIIGLLTFLFILCRPLFFEFSTPYKWLFRSFQLTSIAVFFIESALQTQAGIIFFSFFSMLFLQHYYSSKETNQTV